MGTTSKLYFDPKYTNSLLVTIIKLGFGLSCYLLNSLITSNFQYRSPKPILAFNALWLFLSLVLTDRA